MELELALTIWFVFSVLVEMTNTIYRIVTEKDRKSSWKEDALASFIATFVYVIFLVWMLVEWWM